jgi:hypothetical protein
MEAERSSLRTVLRVLRSLLAVIAGFGVISIGTIITFNLLVGQVTVTSSPSQMWWGTVGAVISGLAGGVTAGLIAPRAPILHALGVWIPVAIDTTSIVLRTSGSVWFDIAGSSILALSALIGGVIAAKFRERPPTG